MTLAENIASLSSSFILTLDNSSTTILTDIQSTFHELEQSLTESKKLERCLKLSLGKQTTRNNQLEHKFSREQSRNERLLKVMKGVDSSTSTTPRTDESLSGIYDNRNALETISPVLMQYRYDELSLSHKRCLKILSRKESLLKNTLSEKESIQAKYDDLLVQFQRLQRRTEVLCCKYFTLQAKKTEEVVQLRELLNYAIKLLSKAKNR